MPEVTQADIGRLHEKLKNEAESSGYHLNSDVEFTRQLLQGLLTNEKRYGYCSCPCRLASGNRDDDLDIICPCDYRDPDLTDHGTCYCSLYVSSAVLRGEKKAASVPEHRPPAAERKAPKKSARAAGISSLPLPVWRCKVCGYLCARDHPPELCPICKAKKDRFERFI
ncbi:MAG: ferredoxin:glutaredoxin reductase [Proteobacteria bacterium]|nr:ferredoxin:glutaredoxin reductase [Pseudomonadota bacterium]